VAESWLFNHSIKITVKEVNGNASICLDALLVDRYAIFLGRYSIEKDGTRSKNGIFRVGPPVTDGRSDNGMAVICGGNRTPCTCGIAPTPSPCAPHAELNGSAPACCAVGQWAPLCPHAKNNVRSLYEKSTFCFQTIMMPLGLLQIQIHFLA